MRLQALVVLLIATQSAFALDLQEYLEQVKKNNRAFSAYDQSKSAAQDKAESGDIQLNPMMKLSAGSSSDKKLPNMLGATETKGQLYSAEFLKKFSSGTALSLSANLSLTENPGTFNANYTKYSQGALGVAVSQSLWKDFFGHATTLRWERESLIARTESANYDLQQRLILNQAEAAYWDYIYTREELKLRQASLERAQKILTWVSRRYSDGIADKADLYNAKALVAARELQLSSSEDEQKASEQKIRDMLEIKKADPIPNISGNMNQARAISSLIQGKGRIVSFDAYLNYLQAKVKYTVAQEVTDAYRPDLVFSGSYNTNSKATELSDATKDWTKTTTPTTKLGVTFTYLFDTDVKKAALSSANKEATSQKMMSERKLLESESQWSELNRRYAELSRKIQSSSQIAEFQGVRAKEEAIKFNKGRSITANVINSEQDAAEAELTLTKLKVEQRKLEAQGRLFIAVQE